MRIEEVKTAFKIMDAKLKENGCVDFVYLNPLYNENNSLLGQDILTTNFARVYLIVVNGVIKKIGGSEDKGGIKGTLQIYKDGGVKGRPSVRSYGIFALIIKELKLNNNVSFYMIYQNNLKNDVKGLFGYHKNISVRMSYKYLEDYCLLDYKSKENNKYPEWNFQEQGLDWPDWIKKYHANLMIESTKRPGRNKE